MGLSKLSGDKCRVDAGIEPATKRRKKETKAGQERRQSSSLALLLTEATMIFNVFTHAPNSYEHESLVRAVSGERWHQQQSISKDKCKKKKK